VKFAGAIAACLLVPGVAAGQQTFRTATDLVALTVTVTDANQQHLGGLDASDFIVTEDGIEQPVSFVSVSELPLDLTLLVDASASMRDKLDTARTAVRGLTRALRPGDRASVVEFHDGLVQRQPLTPDRGAVEAALDRMTAGGGTALYTALYIALSGVEKPSSADAPLRRQCIVVLSDGEDTSSLLGYEDVLDRARRRGVTIYTVALRSPIEVALARNRPDDAKALAEADYAMRALAKETGGQAFFPTNVEALAGIYAAISTELGQQYAIGYTSRNTLRDGAWRRVIVRAPSYPRARLRTRAGYFAEPMRIVRASARADAH
jgi:Ca-activated chloride channel family protein